MKNLQLLNFLAEKNFHGDITHLIYSWVAIVELLNIQIVVK